LCIFLTLGSRGINDIRLVSIPIPAPSHEFEDSVTNVPLTNVVSNRILVEFLGIREESVYSIRGTPRGSRKKPTCRLWTTDANSHMPCHAHAALCRGLETSLPERHGRGMARARHV
jgi:hypothetical protein